MAGCPQTRTKRWRNQDWSFLLSKLEKKKFKGRKWRSGRKLNFNSGCAEEESRQLIQTWEELEEQADPLRKEVASVRKKNDVANRELKPLGLSCQKKEKEYNEAMEAFNEKNKEKVQLVALLMEMMTETERLRMRKLDEPTKHLESTH